MQASNCSTGDVRLVGSGDGDEGRLEVCVNKAWGTVCSDEFDTTDASVACQSLNGFDGSGKQKIIHLFTFCTLKIKAPEILTSGYESGSGPIFLDQLQCSDSDQSLLECGMGRAVGLHRCSHSMDVGIRCTGKISIPCFYDIFECSLLIDIDECVDGSNTCSVNSTCTNTVGSYQCSCFPGYQDEGMGYVCTGR